MAGSSYVIRDTASQQDRVIKLHNHGDGDGTCSLACCWIDEWRIVVEPQLDRWGNFVY